MSHAHSTTDPTDPAEVGPAPTEAVEWDERYQESERIWSGEPNGALLSEVAGLRPGTVLDVGCGEGADAVALAKLGWQVTGLDVSSIALDRGRAHAAAAGVEVTWVHSGLVEADLAEPAFDLVSAQYPALRRTATRAAEHALIDAVAPGGTLLVVHHDLDSPAARAAGEAHGFDPDDWVGPRQVAALLDDGWTVEVDEVRERTVSGGAGAHHTHDVILRARRTG